MMLQETAEGYFTRIAQHQFALIMQQIAGKRCALQYNCSKVLCNGGKTNCHNWCIVKGVFGFTLYSLFRKCWTSIANSFVFLIVRLANVRNSCMGDTSLVDSAFIMVFSEDALLK
jgi:hypothetical protein